MLLPSNQMRHFCNLPDACVLYIEVLIRWQASTMFVFVGINLSKHELGMVLLFDF